jgi:enoyl-CoA hydratase/carnithine racemase
MTDSVRYEADGPVAVIVIDRQARKNAVDRPCADALTAAFRRFEAEDERSVAVLTGAGDTFSAGADLRAIGEGEGNRVAPDGDGPMGPTRMLLDKPTIAAVEGYAVAGGLELAVWCDLRVASRDAVFGVFCRRWGVPLIDGGTVRLPRLIGHSRALDMILTGREVGAEEALSMGLVNRLCDPGAALTTAVELAREIAALPQLCLRRDRRSSYRQWAASIEDAMADELRGGIEVLSSPDFLEGVQRFARRPR